MNVKIQSENIISEGYDEALVPINTIVKNLLETQYNQFIEDNIKHSFQYKVFLFGVP